MKGSSAIVMAAAASVVAAQTTTSIEPLWSMSFDPLAVPQSNDPPPSGGDMAPITTTIWEDPADCTSAPTEWVTVTSGITISTCPLCTDMGPSAGLTTVYTTTFLDICSTGFTNRVDTVTETCSGTTPTWPSSMGPSYMPQGYTTTVTVCTVCAHEPQTVTLTVPCSETPAPTPPTGGPQGPGAPAPGGAPPPNAPAPTGGAPPPPPAGETVTAYTCPDHPKCNAPPPGATVSTWKCPGHPLCGPPAPTGSAPPPPPASQPAASQKSDGQVNASPMPPPPPGNATVTKCPGHPACPAPSSSTPPKAPAMPAGNGASGSEVEVFTFLALFVAGIAGPAFFL